MGRLTDARIRTLPIPATGRKKYADGGGLSLLVAFTGKKVWYLRRRVDGKEQMVRLGAYPDMGLADARKAAEEARALFAACASYWGNRTIRNALLLLALTAARPGMIAGARWEEFDLAGGSWTLPPERMKMRRRFAVPLSAPALEILDEQAGISGGGVFVFPGRDRTRGLSNGALNAALRTLGAHDHVAHGWRSSFSTLAHEAGHFRGEVIEKALAHEQKNRVAAAYDRSELWPERVELMGWWGAFLLEGLQG